MVAMEKEITGLQQQDTAFLSLSNPQHSPHNSPRHNILQSSSSRPIDIPTTPKIIDFFEKSYLQYVHISPRGNLNPNNALNKHQRMELGSCYQGHLTNNNNKCFINITHKCSDYNPETLEKNEQFCIEANITTKQYAHILNNFTSNENPNMTVGRDNFNNYYYINDIQNLTIEEPSSQNNSFLENEPYAFIFDEHDNEYQCHITYIYGIYSIAVNKINKIDNSPETIYSGALPQKKDTYTMLVELNKSQCVMIDKDQNLYIISDLVTHTLQKSYENGILHIRPLPQATPQQEITPIPNSETQPIITNPETTTDSEISKEPKSGSEKTTEQTTLVEKIVAQQTTGKTHNFTPNDNNRKDRMHFLIGSLTLTAICLAVLYQCNKLPNIAELFNTLSRRVQNFSLINELYT